MGLAVVDAETIGMRIKNVRMSKLLTQESLADMLYISRNMVAMMETGRRFPSITTLGLLSDVLGVTTDYILFGR